MFSRRHAALLFSAVLFATLGSTRFAQADASALSIDPTVLHADEEGESQGALMMLLGKSGTEKSMADAGINIYGWVEIGYTYNHRHGTGSSSIPILPGPFNHEIGDHLMLNQVALRFERTIVDTTKFDVGGLVEVMYGSDAAQMHATGLGWNGSDATDDNNPVDDLAVSNLHPIWQFDMPQAYITVNLPVGNGLQLMIGKWNTLLGYETVEPGPNAFYSHSYLFSAVPYTQTGVLGSYQVNEKLGVKLGISRGWDIAMEDNNGCAIDAIGQISYAFTEQLNLAVNWSTGPENDGDSGHYRTVIDPIVTWKLSDQWSFAAEGMYVYDGGVNGTPGDTHHYGDIWGLALYASYMVNDNFTINARAEKAHTSMAEFAGFSLGGSSTNLYEFTLGATITPMPKDPWLKGLKIRPEIRYDYSEDPVYQAYNGFWTDQLTFGADVIFLF